MATLNKKRRCILLSSDCEFPPYCLGFLKLWRHQIDTSSELLSLCAGNTPLSGGFPSQRDSNADLWYFLLLISTNYWTNTRPTGDSRRHDGHLTPPYWRWSNYNTPIPGKQPRKEGVNSTCIKPNGDLRRHDTYATSSWLFSSHSSPLPHAYKSLTMHGPSQCNLSKDWRHGRTRLIYVFDLFQSNSTKFQCLIRFGSGLVKHEREPAGALLSWCTFECEQAAHSHHHYQRPTMNHTSQRDISSDVNKMLSCSRCKARLPAKLRTEGHRNSIYCTRDVCHIV